jgi:Ni,Fe-hydrogenase I cytochrome b subunit
MRLISKLYYIGRQYMSPNFQKKITVNMILLYSRE